jgi:hypothetical protein
MKVLLFVLSTLTLLSTAESNYGVGSGYRYKTKYYAWDRAVYKEYSYTESGCSVKYTGNWQSHTCYQFQRNETVYIEERHTTGGYKRVQLYRHQYGGTPYVSYWTYNGRIHKRHFHHHTYYREPYVDPSWTSHSHSWSRCNFDSSGWGKVIVGSFAALVGADLALNGDTEGVQAIGAALAVAGSLSISSGVEDMKKQSELQRRVRLEVQVNARAGIHY